MLNKTPPPPLPRSGHHDGAGGDGVHHLVRVRGQVQLPEGRLPPAAAAPGRLRRRDPAHLHGLQEVAARTRVPGRERERRGHAVRQQDLRRRGGSAILFFCVLFFFVFFPDAPFCFRFIPGKFNVLPTRIV